MSAEDRRPPAPWMGRLWQPPRAILTHSVAQPLAAAAFVALAFDTALVNVGGMWVATANTRLTIAVPGWYEYWASAEWAAGAGTYRSLAARKNGAAYQRLNQHPPVGGGATTRQPLAGALELLAGDYLEIMGSQDTAGNLNVNSVADYSPRFELCWKHPPHRN
jgi:hypothetical protein